MCKKTMATFLDIDFFILKKISTANPSVTTWTLAKNYNGWCKPLRFESKSKEDYFYIHKTDYIRRRLERMIKYGIVQKIIENNKTIYAVSKKNVRFKRKYKFPDKTGKAICIKEENGESKWVIFQI